MATAAFTAALNGAFAKNISGSNATVAAALYNEAADDVRPALAAIGIACAFTARTAVMATFQDLITQNADVNAEVNANWTVNGVLNFGAFVSLGYIHAARGSFATTATMQAVVAKYGSNNVYNMNLGNTSDRRAAIMRQWQGKQNNAAFIAAYESILTVVDTLVN